MSDYQYIQLYIGSDSDYTGPAFKTTLALTECDSDSTPGMECSHHNCGIYFFAAIGDSSGGYAYVLWADDTPVSGEISFRHVMDHELGHALGLGDCGIAHTDSVMFETTLAGDKPIPLSSNDKDAIETIYGP